MIRFLLLLFTIVFFTNCNKNNNDTIEKLKTEIQFIGGYRYFETPNIDIESLSQNTAKNLTDLLSKKELTASEVDSLGLELAITSLENNSLKIYNFGYDCGGTRGFITHPVVQWKNNQNKLFSYNFSKDINCSFYEIHQLNHPSKQLFLLIGQERGSGACLQNIVYCLEIKDDDLIVDNPFFINRPYINLCNVVFDFNQDTQELIGNEDYNGANNLIYAVKGQGKYSDSEKDNEKLIELLNGILFIEEELNVINLSFNGSRFIKINGY
ncbi:hypothetical protein IMCC3317_28800 [Kordia antarctica]|uniref:Uncharacterized protein n=1 Tax=Kordia antarctica TaxID=1218801 RepID=A0A7L4ZLV8_9FLAO|nr:hypothetical protein [Kordia antarctica]QHI37501.1 hypothetical protein IMCC3317_28800 [Kordia antarctica]